MPLFLSSRGSSTELDITCDKQGHFPPFTQCRWFTSSLESTREKFKKNINLTHQCPPANENLRNQLKTLDSGETKEKEERTRSSKNQLLSQV